MSAQEKQPMSPKPMAARKGQGMVLVQQNNADKSLNIIEINETLETMLGYARGEILNRRVETILGKREAEALADDLEYDDGAPDFGDIFSRIRDVRMRRRTGDEIRVECTLSRLVSQGGNACFQIVIPNEQERVAATKFNEFIALNLEGRKEIDPTTGLPNYNTAKEFLPLLRNYLADAGMSVVFAVIRMDRHQKSLARYGEQACQKLLQHTANCCKTTFRAEDKVFILSDHTLGVVLFDISRESSRVVFNRLRWKVRNHKIDFGGKTDFTITTCIGFDMLTVDASDDVFERCEKAIAELDANERNALIELGAA
jgi:PAS domain S-box-containing protein